MRNKTALTQNLFPATWIHTDPQTPQYMEFCQGIQGLQFAWADLFELALSARSSGAAKARAQPLRWAAARTTPAHYTTNISTSLNISRHLSISLDISQLSAADLKCDVLSMEQHCDEALVSAQSVRDEFQRCGVTLHRCHRYVFVGT
jgi:hypothetical protein